MSSCAPQDSSLHAEPALSPPETESVFTAADHHDAKRKFEAEHLARKLRESGGNINPAAAAIVLERQNLQERIRQLGLK